MVVFLEKLSYFPIFGGVLKKEIELFSIVSIFPLNFFYLAWYEIDFFFFFGGGGGILGKNKYKLYF